MKLAIFGSTGKTGVEIVRQALEQGHIVTAFVRDPERLTVKDDTIIVVVGVCF